MAVTVEVMLTWRPCLYRIERETSSQQDVNSVAGWAQQRAMREGLFGDGPVCASDSITFETAFHTISAISKTLQVLNMKEWTSTREEMR